MNAPVPPTVPPAAAPGRPSRAPRHWQTPETAEQQLLRVVGAPNPLLEAAQPLLRALAEMPDALPGQGWHDDQRAAPPDSAAALRYLLAEALREFQQLGERAGVRHAHLMAAHYLLCTALDEAAHGKSWGRTGWPQHSLLVSLHGDTEGGNKNFEVLNQLLDSPAESVDLIELFYQVLSLGFVGRYTSQPDGRRQLDAVRQRLLGLVAAVRGDVPRDLSPHWRGEAAARPALRRTVPVWLTVTVLALATGGLFAWCKHQVQQRAADTVGQILAIGSSAPAAPAAPAAPPRTARLAERLRDDIARGTLSVTEDATGSTVTFRGDDIFAGGSAQVSARMLPTLDKVAAELAGMAGQVTVIGHSDNLPIRTARFPSNQSLSEARAVTVMEYLAGHGVATGRLAAAGKGDTEPVADNRTPAARARNRRVEIVVTP